MTEMKPTGESALIQWAPNGPLSGVPSTVVRLLASPDGKTFGYGHGPGWSTVFGSASGGVTLLPGQWIARHQDGRIEVTDAPTSCAWWCRFCYGCHDNACPTLHRGTFVPGRCGHERPERPSTPGPEIER